jgi:hypothetical protein
MSTGACAYGTPRFKLPHSAHFRPASLCAAIWCAHQSVYCAQTPT